MAKCFDRIKELVGDAFSDDEIKSFLKETESELNAREGIAGSSAFNMQETIDATTKKLEKSASQAQFLLDREDLQVARSAELFPNFEKFQKSLKRFAEALTFQSKVGGKGARARSLITLITSKGAGKRVELARAILKVKGGMAIIKSKEYEEATLEAINGNETKNKITNELGASVKEYREKTEKEFAKHGVVVNKIDNRGIYQTHDPEKVLKTSDSLKERIRIRKNIGAPIDMAKKIKKVSFERWRGVQERLLDLERTFGKKTFAERNEIYLEAYDNITSDATSLGKKSIQSQFDSSRFFHYKSAAAQLEYNDIYGTGSLFDSLMSEANTNGARLATLELAGNRPLSYIEKTIRLAAKESPTRFTKAEVNDAVEQGKFNMQQTLGHSTTVHGASGKLVKALSFAAAMKIFPGIIPVVLTVDAAPSISLMADLGGRNTFQAAVKLAKIAKDVLKDEPTLRHYSEVMGFMKDIHLGSVEKFSGLEESQLRGKVLSFIMKYSPHEFMNHVEGLAAAHEMTLMLGQHSNLAFDDLPPKLSQTLELYGIDSGRWNLMRRGITRIGGASHITTDALRQLPDEDIKKFLRNKFKLKNVTNFRVEQEREQTQQLFTQMITDKMATASTLVDARQYNFMSLPFNQNVDKGRKAANLFSLAGNLRYYTVAITHRTLGPLIYGDAGESVFRQIIGGKFDKIGLARWAALSYSLGMLGFTGQAVISGRVPNFDDINTESFLSPLGAIGQAVDRGGPVEQKVFGPMGSALFRATDDVNKIMHFDHPGKNALNLLKDAAPGFSSSLGRSGMRHLIAYAHGSMNG